MAEKKKMTQEQKDKMAYGRFINQEAKDFMIKDIESLTPKMYNDLVKDYVLLKEVVDGLLRKFNSFASGQEKETNINEAHKDAVAQKVIGDIYGETKVEVVSIPKLDPSIDVGNIEQKTAVVRDIGPKVKDVGLVESTYGTNPSDVRPMKLMYHTISKQVQDEYGLSWQVEKGGRSGEAVRYIEEETLQERMRTLKSQGKACKVNRNLTEDVPAYSEKQSLINRFNRGFLVLSNNKMEQLGLR